MTNPSKAIGTRAETKVARYLSNHGLPTKRKALAGSADEGDLRMTLQSGEEVTLEVKAGAQTNGYPRSRWEKWLRQTKAEERNSGCRSALVIVRYGHRLVDAEVWVPNSWIGAAGWSMFHLDTFARMMADGEVT